MATDKQQHVVRRRMARSLAKRENAEHLTSLCLLAVIEVSISVELCYWVLAIIVTCSVACREGGLILMFAEEVEAEVAAEVGEIRDRAEREVAAATVPQQ